MAGVAENLNVRVTLTLEKTTTTVTKVVRRRKRFSIEWLLNDNRMTIKRLFHSAVGTLF